MKAADDGEPEVSTQPGRRIYEVFNPEYSVGVACNAAGVVVGLHLGGGVVDHGDAWLAAEIVRVARLARLKSQVGKRKVLCDSGELPHVSDARGLPSEGDYRRAEEAEFGDRL